MQRLMFCLRAPALIALALASVVAAMMTQYTQFDAVTLGAVSTAHLAGVLALLVFPVATLGMLTMERGARRRT